MRRSNIYILAGSAIFIIALCLSIYFGFSESHSRLKGYPITQYAPPCDADPDYLKNLRRYRHYTLNADTQANANTISNMRAYLNGLKQKGDSVNGIHLSFTDDMPVRCYLQAIAVFNELPPREFYTLNNEFYAISKSRYRQRADSLKTAGSIETLEVYGSKYSGN